MSSTAIMALVFVALGETFELVALGETFELVALGETFELVALGETSRDGGHE